MENNSKIKIVNLVNLFQPDRPQFLKLFGEAQKICRDSFPQEEQEPEEKICRYIEESARSLEPHNKIRKYNYLVPVVDGVAKGMYSFDFISNNEGDLVGHLGPLAIEKSLRGQGLSSLLINEAIESADNYRKQKGFKPLGLVGDVNIFECSEDVKKYSVRLKFHHNCVGLGAAVVIDGDNPARLIPYASPGIIKNGKYAKELPFIMGIVPYIDGSLKKISVKPGEIISPDGRLMVEKNTLQAINSNIIAKMQKMIFDDYAVASEIYDLEQICQITDRSKEALEDVKEVYLIPIKDTRYLKKI